MNLQQGEKKGRNPSFELLRIVSILMIVMSHVMNVWMGAILRDVELFSVNYFIGWWIEAYIIVAVNCFVLISGYFMVEQRFRLKRLMLLWLEVVFYTVGIYLVFCGLGLTVFSPVELLRQFLPISTNSLWFVTAYFLMCCVAPFLNLAIRAMDQTQHRNCILVMMLIFVLWATFAGFGDFSGIAQGSTLTWFVILYIIAAYFRKYYVPNGRARIWMGLFLGTGLCLAATKPSIAWITQKLFGEPIFSGAFYINNSPFVLAMSVFLFLFFANVTIKSPTAGRVICFLAPLSLGVLALHLNSYVLKVWVDLLHPYTYANSPLMVPYLIFCTLAVYVVCIAIDAVRQFLFRPLQKMTWPDRLLERARALAEKSPV